jgi:hypothetical protein
MSESLLPTHDPTIDAPPVQECGPGTQLQLEVSMMPLRIDLRGIDLNGKVWEYGFTDDADLVLRFGASARTPPLEGRAVAIDGEGRPLGEVVLLAREGDELVHVCPRPADEGDHWILLSFREASTSSASRANERDESRPHPPHPPHPHGIKSPGEAQPTMILKPKRTCPPTLGKSGPPTLDE